MVIMIHDQEQQDRLNDRSRKMIYIDWWIILQFQSPWNRLGPRCSSFQFSAIPFWEVARCCRSNPVRISVRARFFRDNMVCATKRRWVLHIPTYTLRYIVDIWIQTLTTGKNANFSWKSTRNSKYEKTVVWTGITPQLLHLYVGIYGRTKYSSRQFGICAFVCAWIARKEKNFGDCCAFW